MEGESGVGGEGGRRGVLPGRLKSGAGHHRLEVCGPANGRQDLAYGCCDFFALLRCSVSDIDELVTLYEPNAVFGQFLEFATIVFLPFLPYFLFLDLLFFFFSSFLSQFFSSALV